MANSTIPTQVIHKITRNVFPKDFVFGCATSAYQVEGAYDVDAKSMSNWDAYSMRRPERIQDGSNACVAIDHFHQVKEDVLLMKRLGLEAYRFSICWSRLLPGGRLSSGVNKKGVQFYKDLIDFCLEQGIEPYATIFHFDIPQCLEDEYGGFLGPEIVQDFSEYATLCFWEFGDKVKHWMTINEPWTYAHNGYVAGAFPPGNGVTAQVARILSTAPVGYRTFRRTGAALRAAEIESAGDPGTEPYIVAHHLHLAHAVAVDIYRKQFQIAQGGKIGIANMTTWFEPYSDNEEDKAAASRALDFHWGWFMAPIVHGDYPPVMRQLVGKRLPKFTPEQEKLLIGSYDFIGLNYYTTNYATNTPTPPGTKPTYYTDQQVTLLTERNGVPIGESPGSEWLFIVPRGIHALLTHTKEEYNSPVIYITENGMSIKNDKFITVSQAMKDDVRANYYQDHLIYVKKAMDEGVDIRGYFLWSMFDNYEWSEGYAVRFGIFYVDFANRLARHPKNSAMWWLTFLTRAGIAPRSKRDLVTETDQEEYAGSVKRLRSGRV